MSRFTGVVGKIFLELFLSQFLLFASTIEKNFKMSKFLQILGFYLFRGVAGGGVVGFYLEMGDSFFISLTLNSVSEIRPFRGLAFILSNLTTHSE